MISKSKESSFRRRLESIGVKTKIKKVSFVGR